MKKKVYLAGRYDYIENFNYFARELETAGFEVVCRWLAGDDETLLRGKYPPLVHPLTDNNGIRPENRKSAGYLGRVCIEDVMEADIIIFFSEPLHIPARKGGRMVELGIAIGYNELAKQVDAPAWKTKAIIVVGDNHENAFMDIPEIVHCITFWEALAVLKTEFARV